MVTARLLKSSYLHDELSAPRQTSLCYHGVLWFLLLFGLLDLRQSADGIHSLAVLWAGLELLVAQVNQHLMRKLQVSAGFVLIPLC